VTSVKTDVGGVRTDLGKTQNDLTNTISQLTSMKGDMGQQSGLIARTHDELELLKHKGDRNYIEFTLDKNHRKPVGTISIELKKADSKHNKFTILVLADDRTYEKKDRNVNEPLQFYSGKEPACSRSSSIPSTARTRSRATFLRPRPRPPRRQGSNRRGSAANIEASSLRRRSPSFLGLKPAHGGSGMWRRFAQAENL